MTQLGNSNQLFGKTCTVQVGSLQIPAGQGTGLDVDFRVRRGLHIVQGSLKPQPNTCDLRIMNLSPDHRKQIEKSTVSPPGAPAQTVPCIIAAGYAGRSSTIFSGLIRAGQTTTDGATTTTELTTGDGEQAIAQARLTLALAPKSSAAQALDALVTALGVGPGNVAKAKQLLAAQPLSASMFAKGVILKGFAAEIMTEFCRSVGLEWSIQNGALQITELGKPLDGTAVLIDADHGMVGSPSVDTKGILSVSTLMLPDIKPGVKIAMNAENVQGGFKVIGVETAGSTLGEQWGHHIEAMRY